MKKLICIIFVLLLIGCGGNGNGDSGSVKVIGGIYNDNTAVSISLIREAMAAEIVAESDYSILTDIINPERFADISASEWIIIETTVTNESETDYKNLMLEIFMEDASWLTPESWTCLECFQRFDGLGESCNGVWEVYGGTLIDPQPEPVLPICEGLESTTGVCHGFFPPDIDCDNVSWRIDYQSPGDGLQRAGGAINSLLINEDFFSSYGNKHPEIGIRSDHYARWVVKDSDGKILAQRDYVFNVVP